MNYKKSRKKQVLALLLVVVMVITSLQISPRRVQAKEAIPTETTYLGEGYEVEFKVTNSWNGAFNADVSIKNTGDKIIDNWAIGFIMPHEITDIWNGVIQSNVDGMYVIKNAVSNQDIEIGKSVSFGFSAKCESNLSIPNSYELLCFEEKVSEDQVEIQYNLINDWQSGFDGEISIKNVSDQVIEDWKLSFEFDLEIKELYDAIILEHTENSYFIKNMGYNANIEPGQSITLKYIGSKENINVEPTHYQLSQIVTSQPIEYIDLVDGKIQKDYLYRAIYPYLLSEGKSIDDVKLSDDFDGDGLTLKQEYEYDTNPFLCDTDEDGLSDYDEIFIYFTNPNKYDTDEDGMSDGTEISSSLNPLEKDSDNDGVLDGEEVVKQQVRLDSFESNTLKEVGTLPSVKIEGKGDYSKKLNAVKVENDNTILDINCMVGTPFNFVHEDEMSFERSELTFEISEDILKNNDLKDLAIAWYNEDENALELLETTFNEEKYTISANVDHYSIYMVVSVPLYFFDIDWKNEGSKIESGKADVVFVVDTTGSMYDEIQNVKNNINQFITELETNKVDVRLGLVEYRDIYADGVGSTKSYDWFTNVSSFKNKLGTLGVGGGGDTPESVVDALHCAQNMKFRTGVKKYIIVVTDANYKNGIANDATVTMADKIKQLVSSDTVTSVVTSTDYYSIYSELANKTDGVLANIYENFVVTLRPLINKMGIQVNDGCWIRLSNGSVVRLDKDPSLGDENVDTDKDGIPDVIELKSSYKVLTYNPYINDMQLIDTWSFYSNPVKDDTDGDGLSDIEDLRPSIFDTVVMSNTDTSIQFNTGRVWNNITCNSFDYLDNLFQFVDGHVDNAIPLEEFQVICSNVLSNKNQNFNIDELVVIGLLNNEGSKLYMHDCSGDTREVVFYRLTNRESDYYKHTGILWWEDWKEVPKGTQGGFFRGTVLKEADINFSNKIYNVTDVYTVLNTVAAVGALVIVIIVVLEVTPAVLANIQGIMYYVKTFGVVEGLKMYRYLGISNLPNGVLSLIQADMEDGDSCVDDIGFTVTNNLSQTNLSKGITYYAKLDLSDGDSDLDDLVLGTYNDLKKIYKGTEFECHHLVEKRFINVFKDCSPTLTQGKFLSTPLNPQAHRVFTNLWRQALPYGKDHSLQEVVDAVQKVYANYPSLLEAANKWLIEIGAK